MVRIDDESTAGAAAVTLLISFASVGWWSSFGDRRGRKYVLLIAVLGAMLRSVASCLWCRMFISAPSDSIYLAVAQTKFQDDGVSIALIVNGILGGFATFNGVAYAYVARPISKTFIWNSCRYVSDVSTSSLSRFFTFNVHRPGSPLITQSGP